MSEISHTVAHAGPEHVDRLCPICGEAIRTHQLIQICGRCATVHHRRCWETRGGCSLPRCPANPQTTPEGTVAGPSTPTGTAAIPSAPEADRSSAPKLAFLLMAVILTLLGPIIGIVVGFVWMDSANPPLKRRDGRELLIFCTVVFVFQLIFLICAVANILEMLRTGAFETTTGFGPLP